MPDTMNYDAELQFHNEAFKRACDIQLRDCVLDIGCGTGQTTRDAGCAAAAGSALGVDISEHMIARARALTETEGLSNVTFERADAQVYRFPVERFDVIISRFGTMFFSDPLTAFSNFRQTSKTAGRLVMMIWQAHELNEWSVSIERSLEGSRPVPSKPSARSDAFSLADRSNVQQTLNAAGFSQVRFDDVCEPVYYGKDIDAALDWVQRFKCTQDTLQRLDGASAERALKRLRRTLEDHVGNAGVSFDSRAWMVTARP